MNQYKGLTKKDLSVKILSVSVPQGALSKSTAGVPRATLVVFFDFRYYRFEPGGSTH